VIPGPRPSQGLDRPPAGRERGSAICCPLGAVPSPPADDEELPAAGPSPVTLTRTGRGWTVVSPAGTVTAGDLVEGLSLADVIAEESGALVEPDRTARRSARGPGQKGEPAEDSPEGRIAALQRTVAQLEHALAARVSTERAIGVLAERNRTSPRVAFESLRREARSSGRPVAELAREVLTGLEHLDPTVAVPLSSVPDGPGAPLVPRIVARQPAAVLSSPSPAPAADGRP
jgi:hypothetical protein